MAVAIVALECPQRRRDLVAVEARQPDVDERYLRPGLPRDGDPARAVRRHLDAMTAELEQRAERLPTVGVVLDEKDVARRRLGGESGARRRRRRCEVAGER